jgi:hypothetical protein
MKAKEALTVFRPKSAFAPHPVTSHAWPCSTAVGSSAEIGEAIE